LNVSMGAGGIPRIAPSFDMSSPKPCGFAEGGKGGRGQREMPGRD